MYVLGTMEPSLWPQNYQILTVFHWKIIILIVLELFVRGHTFVSLINLLENYAVIVLLLFFRFIFILCVAVFGLYGCLWTICISGAHRGQNRTIDLLVLKLWMTVSCSVDSGSQIQTLCKSKCS